MCLRILEPDVLGYLDHHVVDVHSSVGRALDRFLSAVLLHSLSSRLDAMIRLSDCLLQSSTSAIDYLF